MSETKTIEELCEFSRDEAGVATLFGGAVRVDETGEYLSVKDCIAILEECSDGNAKFKMNKLRQDKIISENNEQNFMSFRRGQYT